MLYIITWHRHFDVHITLTFTLVPISIMGNLMTARASNLEEAILANKLTYFGGTFLVLMITLTILHLCDIHVNRWIKVLMYALSFIIHLSALTIGWRDWFYKSCDFTIEDGTGFIINKEYGFMHTVFLIVIIAYFTVSFCAMIYSFFRS